MVNIFLRIAFISFKIKLNWNYEMCMNYIIRIKAL